MAGNADIKELAIAAWRLEKWLDGLDVNRKMAAKSALRSINKYLSDSGVMIKDPKGAKFDPGLAVEVIGNESEGEPEETLIITETLSPYIYLDGRLVQHAKVIIGSGSKKEGGVTEKAASEEIEIDQEDIERMMEYAKIF